MSQRRKEAAYAARQPYWGLIATKVYFTNTSELRHPSHLQVLSAPILSIPVPPNVPLCREA
jgi:hypothetical protein